MRTLWALLILLCLPGMTGSGCSGPDPRENPDFDQAAYDDVDASSKALMEDDAVSR